MTAPARGTTVDQPGDVEAYQHIDGTIEILRADDYVMVSLSLLDRDDYHAGFYVDDNCLVMAGVVWYQPVGFAPDHRAVVCKLVRDNRPLVPHQT